MPAKPPVNTKETNPMQGMSTMSKIDYFSLGPIVTKLRQAGASHITIANELNAKYLTGDMPKTSSSAVWRWMRDNGIDGEDFRKKEEYAVNVYQQSRDMLQDVEEQIGTVQVYIAEFKDLARGEDGQIDAQMFLKQAGNVNAMLATLEKLLARKQLILNSIAMMQEKVYNYNNMTEILDIITTLVKERDLTLLADIQEELRKNPLLIEAFKKIQGEKKK